MGIMDTVGERWQLGLQNKCYRQEKYHLDRDAYCIVKVTSDPFNWSRFEGDLCNVIWRRNFTRLKYTQVTRLP